MENCSAKAGDMLEEQGEKVAEEMGQDASRLRLLGSLRKSQS